MLKRARRAAGFTASSMVECMAGHLILLMKHSAHGRRDQFIKMGRRISGAFVRNATFFPQHSGRYSPGRTGLRFPEAKLRTWKPPWFQRRKLLASLIHRLTTHLTCIWYGYSVVFWFLFGIAHISVFGEVDYPQFGPRSEGIRIASEVLIHSWVKSFLGIYYSGYCYILCLFPFCTLSLVSPFAMAPRRRGIPRRGSNSGVRGGIRGRGEPTPHCIASLASVSPPSPSSDRSGPYLHSSLRSCRFKFKSELNRPSISALITVIFSEEEEDSSGSDEHNRDSPVSQNPSDSQGSEAGDILNGPDPQQVEEQCEDSPQQQISSYEDIIPCAPASSSGNLLHMVLPPGRTERDDEDNMMVEWVRSLGRDNDADDDMPPQA